MIRIIQIRAVRSLDPSKWIVKITSGSHEREAEGMGNSNDVEKLV